MPAIRTTTVPVGRGPLGLAVAPGGSAVYVSNFDSRSIPPLRGEPQGRALTTDGKRLYAANSGDRANALGGVGVYTTADRQPLGTAR